MKSIGAKMKSGTWLIVLSMLLVITALRASAQDTNKAPEINNYMYSSLVRNFTLYRFLMLEISNVEDVVYDEDLERSLRFVLDTNQHYNIQFYHVEDTLGFLKDRDLDLYRFTGLWHMVEEFPKPYQREMKSFGLEMKYGVVRKKRGDGFSKEMNDGLFAVKTYESGLREIVYLSGSLVLNRISDEVFNIDVIDSNMVEFIKFRYYNYLPEEMKLSGLNTYTFYSDANQHRYELYIDPRKGEERIKDLGYSAKD